MLGHCVVIVGTFSLGYWINNEKWKLVRAYERALRTRLQRIPSNQDVRINDTERKKFTIIQHRCGVTLMRAGHTDEGVTQLAMAVLASDNPTFLLQHYQRQLSHQLYQQLSDRYRLLERTFEFRRDPCHCSRTAVGKATVGTQYSCTESEESDSLPSRRARSEGLPATHSLIELQPLTSRSTETGCLDGATSFALSLADSIRQNPSSEWESVSQCPKQSQQTSARATKSTGSEDGYASSETSEAFTASSHVSDSGDWVAPSLCSGCFDDPTNTFVTKSCFSDGLAPEISFPSSDTVDFEEWFSSSSVAEHLNVGSSVIPPGLRVYCWRLLGLREDVLDNAQGDDASSINETVRRYCVDIWTALRRALLLVLYYNASG